MYAHISRFPSKPVVHHSRVESCKGHLVWVEAGLMFARERLRKSGAANFPTRDGRTGGHDGNGPLPFGITRRAILGGAAAGAVGTAAHLAGLFDPAPLEIVKTRRGLEVRTGRHVWSV